MTIRKWMKLFVTTLAVGAVSTVVVGLIFKWGEYASLFTSFQIIQMLSVVVWLIGVGFMFSVISQMGFFAYLTVHQFGLGIFRSLWNSVQMVLIGFVLFDLIYLRYITFANEGAALWPYVLPAVLLLLYSLLIAYFKAKQTNQKAFVPALFFMTVVTIVEWFPALRTNNEDWLYLMIFPLLFSNTWQLFLLHRLNKQA